jgi:hypothetical protein
MQHQNMIQVEIQLCMDTFNPYELPSGKLT